MIKRNNKNKCGIFGVFLVFATIIIIISAFISFNAAKSKISSEIDTPLRLTQLDSLKDRFLTYSQESIVLAAQQSYFNLTKNLGDVFPNSCTSYLGSIIIGDNCLIDKDKLENKFIEKFNTAYSKYIQSYPAIAIESNKNELAYYKFSPKIETQILDKKLIIESIGQETNISRHTSFMDYTYRLNINSSGELDLEKEKILLTELKDFISEINSKAKICKTKTTDNAILSCFNEIKSNYFIVSSGISSNYILIEIKTKDKFFFEESGVEKFDNLSFNVAISKS